jgi:hypothetical protein
MNYEVQFTEDKRSGRRALIGYAAERPLPPGPLIGVPRIVRDMLEIDHGCLK